ncbi:hypothetical protein, partial [uncultured Chitinophaga sp.]|uniref:hypothetical protein n=1 Tax=uncultured Chitinophaga sp. TaxID=339340 RepID=UPI0025D6CD21
MMQLMMIRHVGKTLLILLIFSTRLTHVAGQARDTVHTIKDSTLSVADSLPRGFVQKLQEAGHKLTAKNIGTLNANRASRLQRTLFNEIRKTGLEAKLFLEKGIDTLSIARHIEQAKKDMDISLEGVLQNPGPIHTLRD